MSVLALFMFVRSIGVDRGNLIHSFALVYSVWLRCCERGGCDTVNGTYWVCGGWADGRQYGSPTVRCWVQCGGGV